MKKRTRTPSGAPKAEEAEPDTVPDTLSLSSESDLASDSDESDLPEETDSEAGLPSDDLDSDGDAQSSGDGSSERDELDQAFLNVLRPEEGEDASKASQPAQR